MRHYVVEPRWLPGTFTQDPVATTNTYCTWESDLFVNFTHVDRQTELTDDTGSLTGLASGTQAAPRTDRRREQRSVLQYAAQGRGVRECAAEPRRHRLHQPLRIFDHGRLSRLRRLRRNLHRGLGKHLQRPDMLWRPPFTGNI